MGNAFTILKEIYPKPLTLGELVEKLRKCSDRKAKVYFDFCYYFPHKVSFGSWRGVYDWFHFYPASRECDRIEPPTVEELIDIIENEIIGNIFCGYKGGDFTMNEKTPIFVDDYGDASGTAIVDVKDEEYTVRLITRYFDNDEIYELIDEYFRR